MSNYLCFLDCGFWMFGAWLCHLPEEDGWRGGGTVCGYRQDHSGFVQGEDEAAAH